MKSEMKIANTPGLMGRFLLTASGVVFFAVAVIGIVLPGIPTTGPLILASILLAKGNPELRDRLLRLRAVSAYRGYIDGTKEFTNRQRRIALASMWVSIAASNLVLIVYYSTATPFAVPGCFCGGVIGSYVILKYRRNEEKDETRIEPSSTTSMRAAA